MENLKKRNVDPVELKLGKRKFRSEWKGNEVIPTANTDRP